MTCTCHDLCTIANRSFNDLLLCPADYIKSKKYLGCMLGTLHWNLSTGCFKKCKKTLIFRLFLESLVTTTTDSGSWGAVHFLVPLPGESLLWNLAVLWHFFVSYFFFSDDTQQEQSLTDTLIQLRKKGEKVTNTQVFIHIN